METWYEVSKWATSKGTKNDGVFIHPVKVSKSTDKTVWVENDFRKDKFQRSLISSDYTSYFKTFDEAKQFALDRQSRKIASKETELESAKADYAKIRDQVDPVLFDE